VRVGPRVPTPRRPAPAPAPAYRDRGTLAAVPGRQRHGAARGIVKLITLSVVGIAALAIVGGLFVAVCIESLVAPKAILNKESAEARNGGALVSVRPGLGVTPDAADTAAISDWDKRDVGVSRKLWLEIDRERPPR
jgi:hypothetical protein